MIVVAVAALVPFVGSVDASVVFGSWPAVFVVVGLADVSFLGTCVVEEFEFI